MKNLAKKMLEIYREIGPVEKEGHNSNQNYKYFMEAQIASTLQRLFLKNGIAVFTSTESYEVTSHPKFKGDEQVGTNFMTHVKTKHTLVDVDSGENIDIYSCGSGFDSGDKGMYKAITGSFKYFMMKNAFVSDNQDPENDANEAVEKLGSLVKKGKISVGMPSSREVSPAKATLPTKTSKSKPISVEIRRAAVVDNPYVGKLINEIKPDKVVFHFGKNIGKELCTLSKNDLEFWSTSWFPKKFNDKYSDDDLKLDAALTIWANNGGKFDE